MFRQGHDARFAAQLAAAAVSGEISEHYRGLLKLPGNWALRKSARSRLALIANRVRKHDPRLAKTAEKITDWAKALEV